MLANIFQSQSSQTGLTFEAMTAAIASRMTLPPTTANQSSLAGRFIVASPCSPASSGSTDKRPAKQDCVASMDDLSTKDPGASRAA